MSLQKALEESLSNDNDEELKRVLELSKKSSEQNARTNISRNKPYNNDDEELERVIQASLRDQRR